MDIYSLSEKLNKERNSKYACQIIEELLNGEYTNNQRHFVFQQLKRFYLKNGDMKAPDNMQELYDAIVAGFRNAMGGALPRLPKESRNKNRIVVIVLQFLGPKHAPTKTAMERIETLQKMGYEVLVIHSMELLSLNGEMPFYNSSAGNYVEQYNGLNNIEGVGGNIFTMYQPATYMPQMSEMEKIAMLLMEYAPDKIVMLGNNCVLGDLMADMIPTVCIPMAFSTMPKKRNQLVITARNITEGDYKEIDRLGIDRNNFEEGIFTFKLIEQTTKLSREKLGLPEDKFILSVVGIRLDYEVSDDFLIAVKAAIDNGCHLAFAGKYDTYDAVCARFEWLKEGSTYVGYQDDILAFIEVCDLYINPPRLGGGFSVVEAFFMHKPGITMGYGDVAACSGPDFYINGLDELSSLICKYKDNADFYKVMSDKAYERSQVLFDSEGALRDILDKLEKWEKLSI